MTGKQSFFHSLYPLMMKLTGWLGVNSKVRNNTSYTKPILSFYELATTQNNGNTLPMQQFKGKKVLLVNTASDCGYTAQFAQLQQLHTQFPELVILGFPANDFKEQEKGSDQDIAQYCQLNYGVTFPLMKKSVVIRNNRQNSVFQWLTNSEQNGWNNQAPEWNFGKYLVDEKGVLIHYFGPSVSPLNKKVIQSIKK